MANLHKTERKLPWWVRDGGLPSDWLGGRIGGEFFAVTQSNLCGVPDTAAIQTHTFTGKAQICSLNTVKNQKVPISQ